MTDFMTFWHKFHPDGPPLAHELRTVTSENWIRFYYLPEGERYARSADERSEVRHRQNTLAEDVLGSGAGCWFVHCLRLDQTSPGWRKRALKVRQRDFPLTKVATIEDSDNDPFTVYAAKVVWDDRTFKKTLKAIADDRLQFVLWASVATGSVFAPYDGGVDLFPAQKADLDRLIVTYSDWLSSYPGGL